MLCRVEKLKIMNSSEKKAFVCPSCGHSIEKRHAFFLNNFSTVECSNCHTKLVPELRETAKIGLIFGGIGGFIGFAVPISFATLGYPVLGFSLLVVLFAILYSIVVSITRKRVSFRIR